MSNYYILNDDGDPVVATEPEWWEWMSTLKRGHLAFDVIENVTITTVFLGLNHQLQPTGPPVLYETRIFGGDHDQYQHLYCNKHQALAGHDQAVALVQDKTI